MTTVAVVVLLFSYRTSTMGASAPAAATAAGANAPGIVSGSTSDAAGAPPDDPTDTAPADPSSGTPSAAPTGAPTDAPTAAPRPTATTAAPKAASNLVVNGTVAQTRWGPVQVQVHISGNKITDVKTLQIPNGNNRDYEINSYAVPQLHDEVLQAQSANIDVVSGATVTSDGYIESLQAALDSAHFKG
ncbi:FMN-binding protein [Planosporangium thailandense]|uniref:FMN-binding protein n=1 Tax=Planosporangium thailandense TaxID=765197 RepID=UPI0030B842E5